MAEGSETESEFIIKKKVDETWKDAVQKEKQVSPGKPRSEEARPVPEADFMGFVSTLAMQSLMALGEVPNPATRQAQTDLPQAQYLIDVLQVLSDKTQGNLTPEEDSEMKNLLYELRMKFVRKNQEGSK